MNRKHCVALFFEHFQRFVGVTVSIVTCTDNDDAAFLGSGIYWIH